MTYSTDAGDYRRGATPEQLRAAIDSGRTGERCAGCDPAAAPLSTDDEAAGAPPPAEWLALDMAQARTFGRSTARANAATPELTPDARLPPQPAMTVVAAFAGAVAAAVLGFVLFAVL